MADPNPLTAGRPPDGFACAHSARGNPKGASAPMRSKSRLVRPSLNGWLPRTRVMREPLDGKVSQTTAWNSLTLSLWPNAGNSKGHENDATHIKIETLTHATRRAAQRRDFAVQPGLSHRPSLSGRGKKAALRDSVPLRGWQVASAAAGRRGNCRQTPCRSRTPPSGGICEGY